MAYRGEMHEGNKLTGIISSARLLGGQVQGIRGYKGEAGHSPVLTSEKYGTTTVIYSDGDELAQIEDGATIDVKIRNKIRAADTTAYNSVVNNGIALINSALLGNVGCVVEATDEDASVAMKHRLFKTSYSSGVRLTDGGIVLVKFMADVYGDATINLHIQDAAYTGDIPIYENGAAIAIGSIIANDIVLLMYDDANTRFNIIGKSYKTYTSTSNGLVPPSGVPSSDEMKILTHRGWQTIVTYNYSTLDAFLEAKAFTTSPTFTGTPKAPTAASGTDTTQIATTAFVQDAISGIGGGDVTDVTINDTSIVDQDGVADIPIMTGATASAAAAPGLTPSSDPGDQYAVLTGQGVWLLMDIASSVTSSGAKIALTVGDEEYNTNIPFVSTTSGGIMSSSDKTKLNSISMTNGVIDASCLPVWNGGVV